MSNSIDYDFFNHVYYNIMDNLHQIDVFRNLGTTWGEDKETFIDTRLENIENLVSELKYLYEEVVYEIDDEDTDTLY